MIHALESRASITELIHRYAYHVRMREGERCADLFTEDATYTLYDIDPLNRSAIPCKRWQLDGRQAIRDYIGKSTQSDIRICPIIHNVMIDISGDTARSNCIMTSETWPAGYGTCGQYDDIYALEDGKWLFKSRVYTIFSRSSGDQK